MRQRIEESGYIKQLMMNKCDTKNEEEDTDETSGTQSVSGSSSGWTGSVVTERGCVDFLDLVDVGFSHGNAGYACDRKTFCWI